MRIWNNFETPHFTLQAEYRWQSKRIKYKLYDCRSKFRGRFWKEVEYSGQETSNCIGKLPKFTSFLINNVKIFVYTSRIHVLLYGPTRPVLLLWLLDDLVSKPDERNENMNKLYLTNRQAASPPHTFPRHYHTTRLPSSTHRHFIYNTGMPVPGSL